MVKLTLSPEVKIPDGLEASLVGQNNGLCSAASPGILFLLTGLHTGDVHFTLDVFDSAPPFDHFLEEIVEVLFIVKREEVCLTGMASACAAFRCHWDPIMCVTALTTRLTAGGLIPYQRKNL
jgi:hypothetical protein